VLQFLTDEANYQKEVNARVAALDRTYVVGITASFRRDDLSREDQAAWVASEFGAYAYVVAMPAGDRNLEQQAGAERLDSQQVGGVPRERARVFLHCIHVYFGKRAFLCALCLQGDLGLDATRLGPPPLAQPRQRARGP
jgi:hypothetical protein